MKRQFAAALMVLLGLSACQAQTPLRPSVRLQAQQSSSQAQTDRYLCVIEPKDEQNAIIKVLDFSTQQIRSVYLPGRVLSMDGDQAAGKLYLSVKSGSENPQYFLYILDLKTLSLSRPALFNQAGLAPIDFEVKDQDVFVSGQRAGQGTLVAHSLKAGGWNFLASQFHAGFLEWSRQPDLIYSVFFDEEQIIRTSIDVKRKQIIGQQRLNHGIPFGNNVGLVAPSGDFFYAFHQLQGHVELFAFDIEEEVINREVASEKAVGILYASVISNDGRYLYATMDNRIERFELQGTQLRRLPPIELKFKEARHLSLSQDQRTLYVSHEREPNLTRIRLLPDLNYQLDVVAMPGQNTELAVF